MNIGMLWFDNDPKADLSAKIVRASVYYRDKYGQAPNLCLVHPSEFVDSAKVEGVTTRQAHADSPRGAHRVHRFSPGKRR